MGAALRQGEKGLPIFWHGKLHTDDEVRSGSWAVTCKKKTFAYYPRVNQFLSTKHNLNPSSVVASGMYDKEDRDGVTVECS